MPSSRESSQPRDCTQVSRLQVDSLPWAWGKPKNTGVGSLSLLQRIILTQNRARISCIAGRFFTSELPGKPNRHHTCNQLIIIISLSNNRLLCYKNYNVCVCSATQLYITLYYSMNCSLPGSSVHWIFKARILEQVAISYSWASYRPRDWTLISWISCIGMQILYQCITWETLIITVK